MKFTLAELAGRLGGKVEGNGDREITGVASLKDAGPGDLTFISGSRYLRSGPADMGFSSMEANEVRRSSSEPDRYSMDKGALRCVARRRLAVSEISIAGTPARSPNSTEAFSWPN